MLLIQVSVLGITTSVPKYKTFWQFKHLGTEVVVKTSLHFACSGVLFSIPSFLYYTYTYMIFITHLATENNLCTKKGEKMYRCVVLQMYHTEYQTNLHRQVSYK